MEKTFAISHVRNVVKNRRSLVHPSLVEPIFRFRKMDMAEKLHDFPVMVLFRRHAVQMKILNDGPMAARSVALAHTYRLLTALTFCCSYPRAFLLSVF